MADYAEGNFYYIDKVKMGEEYHVALYKALMGIWEARETFINSLQEGITYRKLELGIEKDGEKIPFFKCDDGKFYIPEIKVREKLEGVDTLLSEFRKRFGIREGKNQGSCMEEEKGVQDYDIRITEKLSKIVTVRAESMESALSDAHDNYSDAKKGYVMDYEDMQEVTFSMAGIHLDLEKQKSIGGR